MTADPIQIIYHIGSVNKSKGLKSSEKLLKKKIIQWGGFVALLYVTKNAKIELIKQLCRKLNLPQYFTDENLVVSIHTIKIYLSKQYGKPELEEDSNTDNSPIFPK